LALPFGCLKKISPKRGGSKQTLKQEIIACFAWVKPSPEVSTPQNHTKREWRLMPPSPEKELQNMSPGIMPGSWEDESPIEPIVKTHEYYERDIETRKGTAQHVLMEFDHSGEVANFLSNSGEAQPQSLRKTEQSLTTEEVGSLGSLVDLNIDLSTHHTNNIQEENPQLHRLIEDLLQRLSELNENKQIAEEKADRLSEKVKSMKERLSYHMTVVEHCKTLSSKAKELAEENHVLKEQLNDAQSHIFSLQPYRKDLTPEEVGQVRDLFSSNHTPLCTVANFEFRITMLLLKKFRTGSRSS
jgi:chromosome segregation ATPase